MKVAALKKILLIVSLFHCFSFSYGQKFVLKKLQSIEQKNPEKLKKAAERFTKIFPEKPVAYYFLSKIEMEKFLADKDDKVKFKSLNACLKQATKAQKYDDGEELLNINGWHLLNDEIKTEGYFYFQETTYSEKLLPLKRKYYLFLSKGESDYLLESELNLSVPKEQQIDTLFYGMPTGKEIVKRDFPVEEEKMLSLINEERKKRGLSILVLDSSMSAACRYHGYDMATQKYFNHFGHDVGADGRVYFANYTFDRIRQFYNETRVLGENISSGRNNAHFTYKGWYNSPGHNKIMFNPSNNRVGIGMIYVADSENEYYWVLCTAE